MAVSFWLVIGIVLILLGAPFVFLVLTDPYAGGMLGLAAGVMSGSGFAFLIAAVTSRTVEGSQDSTSDDAEWSPL